MTNPYLDSKEPPAVTVNNIIVGGGGTPTFIAPETPKRADSIPSLSVRISESEQRSESIKFAKLLEGDGWSKADAYRIPTGSLTATETIHRANETIGLPPLRVSESHAAGDLATIQVILLDTGSKSVAAPVTGNHKLRAWGTGGSGGGGLVGRGGAGAGGMFAESTVSFTAGNTIFFSIPVGPAGGAASTAGTTGADAWANSSNAAPSSSTTGALAKSGAAGGAGGTGQGTAGTGSTTGGIGTTLFRGGNGFVATATIAGAGGGGAGTTGAGGDATSGVAGTGTARGGGNGGVSAAGSQAGGGGGGGAAAGAGFAGANGAAGFQFSI